MLALDSQKALARVYPVSDTLEPKRIREVHDFVAFEKRLNGFALGCMPMVTRGTSDSAWRNKWLWRLASTCTLSMNYQRHATISRDELAKTITMMQDIADVCDRRFPPQIKAFILHNLLTHVIAYRPMDYFVDHPDASIPLPVRHKGVMRIEPCRFDREVNLFGGVMAKIFVPKTGRGSATYLFAGTTPWMCADGAGVGLIDDFNPFGPGEGLRLMARSRLASCLKEHLQQLGEPALVAGHSLGAILAASLAVDLPNLVGQSVGFNPARATHSLASQWRRLASRAPQIDSFVCCFANGWDLTSYVGSQWIGNVYKVAHTREADWVQRHIMPAGARLGGPAHIVAMDTEKDNQSFMRRTGAMAVAHAIFVLPFAITLIAIVAIKRFLFGWSRGGRWRWGVLGVLCHREPVLSQ